MIVGFTLSFMILFKSKAPFEDFSSALFKIIIMMTSEFEYKDLFSEDTTLSTTPLTTPTNHTIYITITKIIFIFFVFCISIILMNLMIGIAVNDINDLKVRGKISTLADKVHFLSNLDAQRYNKIFSKILPMKTSNFLKNEEIKDVTLKLKLTNYTNQQPDSLLPWKLQDDIINIALKHD